MPSVRFISFSFFFNDTATTEIYTLSLHDALPISLAALRRIAADAGRAADIRLLPDASVREEPAAVVTAAVAPLLCEPRITADRVSETLHGEPLALLERREEGGGWLRVRA